MVCNCAGKLSRDIVARSLPEVLRQGVIHLMLKIRLLQLQEPNWGTFRNKESLFPVANNGRLSLQLTFFFLAKRLHAKARLRNPFFPSSSV